jgi:hypothetical protein
VADVDRLTLQHLTVHVEPALNPVHVSVENDYAVYVESKRLDRPQHRSRLTW